MKNSKKAYCIQLLPLYVYKLYHSVLYCVLVFSVNYDALLFIHILQFVTFFSVPNLLSCLPRLCYIDAPMEATVDSKAAFIF